MANQGVMATPIFDELVAELNQTFADEDVADQDKAEEPSAD